MANICSYPILHKDHSKLTTKDKSEKHVFADPKETQKTLKHIRPPPFDTWQIVFFFENIYSPPVVYRICYRVQTPTELKPLIDVMRWSNQWTSREAKCNEMNALAPTVPPAKPRTYHNSPKWFCHWKMHIDRAECVRERWDFNVGSWDPAIHWFISRLKISDTKLSVWVIFSMTFDILCIRL